jgi:hypothetical protein
MNTSSKSGSIGLNLANPATGTISATNFNLAGGGTPTNQLSNAAVVHGLNQGQMHTHLRSASDIADRITDNIETREPSDVIT